MKEKPVKEHRDWYTCSFILQADSRFGDPTHVSHGFGQPLRNSVQNRVRKPVRQPMRKPGTAVGRARYVEVGGRGGNGWRQRRPPAVGGRKRPAVAVAGWWR